LALILALVVNVLAYEWNDEWGNTQYVQLAGYTYNYSQAMEPFLSRDGRYLFWNSRNVGANVSLQVGVFVNSTYIKYLDEMTGQANSPIPHLDAVPSMDMNNNFYWVSTRDYPQNPQNLQTGVFDAPTHGIPRASHVEGSFYHSNADCCWICMDQEINEDGSILFFSNAFFPFPPGPIPSFSNISLAIRAEDGTWMEHPNAVKIMETVNNVVDPMQLRYSPASLGKESLELYFTVRVSEDVVSGIFVAKRASADDVFGPVERLRLETNGPGFKVYLEPEAPTISSDGKLLMFNRMDCNGKYGCHYINIYKMDRIN